MRSSREPMVCGHRGGRAPGYPPENTLAAFLRACDEGAHAIELDVRATRDGELVVLHDPVLDRIAGERGRVCDRTARDLLRIELPGGHRIARLDEALDALRGRAVVNVEIKADLPDRIALVRKALRIVHRSGAEVVLSSFHPGVVALARAGARGVEIAQLVPRRMPWLSRTVLGAASPRMVHAIHLEDSVADEALVRRLVGRGLRVAVWTVNDVARARLAVSWGAAWIITDAPAVMVGALSERR